MKRYEAQARRECYCLPLRDCAKRALLSCTRSLGVATAEMLERGI